MEALNDRAVFKNGLQRWPDRPGLEICAVTEMFRRAIIWYIETDTGNKNCHMLTEQEYIEIDGKKYTVADGADRISAALEKEKIKKMLDRM